MVAVQINFKPNVRRQRGLTLVELMVVVAVLAVLAGIAYPLYTAQTQKARRADAKIGIEKIAMAQERFYTVSGRYAVDLSSLQVSPQINSNLSDEGFYTIPDATVTNGGQSFTVRATKSSTGPQASDNDCDWFQIDETGLKTAEDSGGTSCW